MLKDYQLKVNQAIDDWLPSAVERPQQLHKAMRYSLQAGGKRLRPILVLAGSQLFPLKIDPLPAAVAVECFHTATLIHDDLPAMDDSALRRGLKTCHVAFDEATALLAADALMVESFKILAEGYAKNPHILRLLIVELSLACSSRQLMGGQMEDLLAEKEETPSADQLDFIHRNKTAALIRASLTMGALLTEAQDRHLEIIQGVGESIGLAFQIIDDVLDVSSDSVSLGKSSGQDDRNHKLTYPRFYGVEASKKRAKALTDQAIHACEQLGADVRFLKALCQYMLVREA